MPYRYTLGALRTHLLQARDINLVVDVGASEGLWARDLRKAGYSGDILSLEPLSEPFGRLQARTRRDPRWRCERVAVGGSSGTLTMNVSRQTGWSSPLPLLELTARAAPLATYVSHESVPVRTLDEILEADGEADTPLAIKVDVQGFEYAVLDGAGSSLTRCQLLDIELSLVPLYEGQRLWREMVDRIEQLGFQTAWVESCRFVDPGTRSALQLNLLFLRP